MQLFVNARFLAAPLTGVQRYSIEISRQIKKFHPATRFLSPYNIRHHAIAEELGAEQTGQTKGHLWEQVTLPSFLKKNGNPSLFNPANTAPLAYENNFITIHDLAFFHFPHWNSLAFRMWYNYLIPKIAKRAKHIFTVSETMREELAANLSLPLSSISVSYNGIPEVFKKFKIPLQKEPLVLAVGSINQRKGYSQLVAAFLESRISATHQLVIVGNRDKIFASVPGLSQRQKSIIVCEGITDEELVDLYQRADILVSLSEYEGFGIPVLEGLFFGCKVLCSDIPTYRELFGDYAYFCNSQNIKEIITGLESISDYPSNHSAPESLMNRFDFTHSALTILKCIASETTTLL